MANFWLDTPQYQAQRREQMDAAMLGRVYYEGNPYEISSRTGNGMFRLNILQPLQEYEVNSKTGMPEYQGPGFTYDYNIAKARIDQMVAIILPNDAQFHIEGIQDDENKTKAKELLAVIADLGSKYQSTPSGILQWMRKLLVDAAQTSDGLIVPRYMPKDGNRGGFVRLQWVEATNWDAELDEEGEDALFYRIQEKRWGKEGRVHWVRWDIWADKIIKYKKQDAHDAPEWHMMFPGLHKWENVQPNFFPGTMEIAETTEFDTINSSVLKQIDGLLPVPIRYEDGNVSAFRGVPECTLPDFRSIDKANLHLGLWSSATEETNYPALFIADAMMPKDAQGRSIVPNFKSGSQHELSSQPEKQLSVGYPENIPTEFGFGDILEQLLQISFAHVPYMGRKPADLRAFSELSGYAHNVIYKMMNSRAEQVRDRAVDNGIMVALKNALALASTKGILPDGVDANKVEFKIVYPDAPVTADEALKKTINAEAGLRIGVPAKVVVKTLPFPIADENEAADAISEKQELGLEMDKAVQAAKASADSLKDTDDNAGIDNNAR